MSLASGNLHSSARKCEPVSETDMHQRCTTKQECSGAGDDLQEFAPKSSGYFERFVIQPADVGQIPAGITTSMPPKAHCNLGTTTRRAPQECWLSLNCVAIGGRIRLCCESAAIGFWPAHILQSTPRSTSQSGILRIWVVSR